MGLVVVAEVVVDVCDCEDPDACVEVVWPEPPAEAGDVDVAEVVVGVVADAVAAVVEVDVVGVGVGVGEPADGPLEPEAEEPVELLVAASVPLFPSSVSISC